MLRVLLALAVLVPFAAHAGKPAKKKKPADGAEIWPPPDPATTGADPEPKPKSDEPKKDEAKPVDDADKYKLDPELRGDDDAPKPKQRAKPSADDGDQAEDKSDDDADDACADKFDDCKEDCTIAHATDDTLHVKGKLPVQKCVTKCQKKYDLCSEQREAGFPEKEKDRDRD